MIIKYANKNVIVIVINSILYYIDTTLMNVYDRNMTKMNIPNIDSWIQSITQQRYSYQSVCDMGAAFEEGLKHTYSLTDIKMLSDTVSYSTIQHIFKSTNAKIYATHYWVELADKEIMEKVAVEIGSKLQIIQEKLGTEKLISYISRLYHSCDMHGYDAKALFVKLAERLNQPMVDVKYPDTTDLDYSIAKAIWNEIHSNWPEIPGISDDIVNKSKLLIGKTAVKTA